MGKTATPTLPFFRSNGRNSVKRLAVLTTLIVTTLWALSPLWNRLDQNRQLEALNRQLKNAKQHEAALRAEIKLLQTDNEYIERTARERLGLIRPDEEGYVVVDPRPQSKAASPAVSGNEVEPTKKEDGWWRKSLDYLYGLWEQI